MEHLTKIDKPVYIGKLNKYAVKELQTGLNKALKDHDSYKALAVDGIVGVKTKNAWSKFLHLHYLETIDENTVSRLVEVAGKEINVSDNKLPKKKFTAQDDHVQYQINKLNGYSLTGTANLATPARYFSQRDNYRQAHRTCNGSSNAMYLDWLMRAGGRKGLSDDAVYLKQMFKIGDTIYHSVQTKVIKHFGYSTQWRTDRRQDLLDKLLKVGFVVPVNILHRGTLQRPTGGHVIALVGITDKEYIAHDPYGTLMSNYSNHNGKHSKIPKNVFNARWQGGYRILA